MEEAVLLLLAFRPHDLIPLPPHLPAAASRFPLSIAGYCYGEVAAAVRHTLRTERVILLN